MSAVVDRRLDCVRLSLRSLFIDELRLDDGWSDFIDALLAELDIEALYYLQRDGFPYILSSDFYPLLFSPAAATAGGTLWVDRFLYGGYWYFVFNPALGSAVAPTGRSYTPMSDWGVIPVEAFIYGGAAATSGWVCQVAVGSASTSSANPSACAGLAYGDTADLGAGGSHTFVIRVSADVMDNLSTVAFGIRQREVPNAAAVSLIRIARNAIGVGTTLGGIQVDSESIYSRLRLFGWRGASDDKPLDFSVQYLGAAGFPGDTKRAWRAYFTPAEIASSSNPFVVLKSAAVAGGGSVINVVSKDRCLASSLESQFFWGGSDAIYGYDKKLWVVPNNYGELDPSVATGAVLEGAVVTTDRWVSFSAVGSGEVEIDNLSDIDPVLGSLDEFSVLDDSWKAGDLPGALAWPRWPLEDGYLAFSLSQEYISRTFSDDEVVEVRCVFALSRSEVMKAAGYAGDEAGFDVYLAYLRMLFLRSMPVGVNFRFQFGYPRFDINLGFHVSPDITPTEPFFEVIFFAKDRTNAWVRIPDNAINSSNAGEYRAVIRSNRMWEFKKKV